MRYFFYQAKMVVKEYKTDEFIGCLRALLPEFRKEKGGLDYSLWRDIEKENTYSVVGEWKTRKAMEKHFQTPDFEVLIGAARVLGETFEMNIAEVKEKGGFELARKQMASQDKESAAAD
jgi:quinol monooxygenase YgiN